MLRRSRHFRILGIMIEWRRKNGKSKLRQVYISGGINVCKVFSKR
ncbi:hypothetical protein HMPREF3293_02938 [Christensenella minuta]|uniref:Uncharacterized protein n=1 Tax=Christensenella minuta TaxID=626937 RepID=A0A136Q0S9_9FIRM|nr:hypothetical protein HMPREF3293_02938 [Christensenella minuta]